MLRRTATIVSAVLVVALGLAAASGVAGAQTNPNCQNQQGYNTQDLGGNAQVQQGQDHTENFDCAPPNTDMNVQVNSANVLNLGTVRSDANGRFSVTFNTASLALGPHTVTATGAGITLTRHFTVVGPAAAGAPIPRTGSSSTIPMVSIALALLGAGGLLVLFARRRRSGIVA